jgi:hypothetical protein
MGAFTFDLVTATLRDAARDLVDWLQNGHAEKRCCGRTTLLPHHEESVHYAPASNTDSRWHSSVWGVSWGDNRSLKRHRGKCIVIP